MIKSFEEAQNWGKQGFEAYVASATAWTKGLSKAGVLNSLKHFPGHGDTALDSHLALPVLDKSQAELQAQA